MTLAARHVLESIVNRDSDYVFPGRNGGKRADYRRIARRVKEKANLPKDFRPLHGLRHNYASRLASSGEVELYTLQRLLTHSSPQMTQRYAHLRDETLMKAASLADGMLLKMKKKNNDPYEIAKISMFYNNFLYNEIVKRHIEEYKPQVSQKLQELAGKIKKYNQTKNNIYNYENIFNVVVGQDLDLYRLDCRGYKPIISDEVEKLRSEHVELLTLKKCQNFI